MKTQKDSILTFFASKGADIRVFRNATVSKKTALSGGKTSRFGLLKAFFSQKTRI